MSHVQDTYTLTLSYENKRGACSHMDANATIILIKVILIMP